MKILFFLIALSFSINSYAQDEELIKFDPEKEYTQSYLDSLTETRKFPYEVSDLKKILESDKLLKGWVFYYNKKASDAINSEDFESGLIMTQLAIEAYENDIQKRSFDEKYLIRTYELRAYSFELLRDYNSAVKNHIKALNLTKKYPYKWKSFIIGGLAACHKEMGNDSLALKYMLQTSRDTLYMSLSRPAVVTFTDIGGLYDVLKKKDSAKYYYMKALNQSLNSEYKDNITTINGCLGSMFYEEGQVDSTYYYFEKAVEANSIYGMGSYTGAEQNLKVFEGYLDFQNGKIKEARDKYISVIDDLSQFDVSVDADKKVAVIAFEMLGKCYKHEGEINEIFNLLKMSSKFFEKAHKDQMKVEINKLEASYQTKQKDASIAQLEENKQQQDTIIKQQKTIAFGLGGGLLLLSGLGYLFWRQRKLKNQYEKENLEQRLLRSQMNPHFIGNAMNTVSALVDKQSKDAIPYINKLSNLFRLVLTNSREEFVSLDDELATLNSYLELQSNFSKDFDFNFSVDEAIDKEDYVIPPMLMQPFIENAILHGLKQNDTRGKVEIKITKNDKGLLLCEIDDNGVGYSKNSESKTRKSVSGDIIKERLEILKKKFKVNSRFLITSKKEGTHVALYLPYLLDT